MTDISQLKTHADLQPGPVAPLTPSPFATYTNGVSSLDGTVEDEESSTIRCICGYADDDGNTVLCERCDTWQHIVCYYGNPDNVPDVHECVHCTPRQVDTKSAAEIQRHLREINSKSEGRKRPPPKSTKKKVRDTPQVVPLTNGWSSTDKTDAPHQQTTDRKSASPRDQPPPAKRPKTSHRASISISGQIANPSLAPPARKRASSTLANGQSPVKSPSTPITNGNTEDYLSPEFMQLYRCPEFTPVDANSYTDTGIPNLLIEWLTDRDALAAVTGGSEPAQIYSRIDDPMEELERSAPQLIQEMEEDPEVTIGGLHPIWHYLVSPVDLPSGGFIGELKGQIGRRQDYCSVPSNRWDTLRHPLPFVFFHPSLPLYIDTRHEGSLLRYVRRSCRPNLSISILITEERHYHFCLIAQSPIAAGDELTIGWEIDKSIHHSLNASVSNGNIRKDGLNSVGGLSRWAAGVLSNFGKCACHLPKGDCALERAIKRKYYGADANTRQIKTVAKTKKVKKSQTSPTGTGHAINSRAGSETVNRAEVDDNADTRSASGSSRSKPASRDITPMTHVSTDAPATVGVELSDRERRKIMNLERQFEQMAHDEQQKRKKRNSGGSTLNTPSADIAKQLGIVETSPSSSLPLNPTLKSMGGEGPGARGSMSSRSGRPLVRANGPIPKQPPRPKPVYCDASTQTGDGEPRPPPRPIKRVFNVHLRRLLARCKQEREQQERIQQERISRAQSSIVVGEAQQTPTQSPIPESAEPMDQGSQTGSPSTHLKRDQPTPAASVPENPMQIDGDETSTQPKPAMDSSATCTTENIVEEVMKDALPETPKSESDPGPEVADAEPKAAEQDVEMKDIEDAEKPVEAPSPTENSVEMTPVSSNPLITSSDPVPELEPSIQPSPPPHSATNESPAPEDIISDTTASLPLPKPPLHVDLPPTFDFSAATSSAVPITPSSVIPQSPSSIAPPSIFSPSVASAATASPLRKKLSLSEFTSRRKRNMEAQSVATPQAPSTNGSAGLNGSTPSLEVPPSSAVIVSSPLRETMSAGNSPAVVSPSPSDSAPNSKSHPPPPLFNTST